MTVAWQSIQDGLQAIVASAAGLPVTAVTWRPLTGQWNPQTHVRLQVLGGLRAIGVDERRQRYDAGEDALLERIYGNRAIPISIRVETQDQDLVDSAYALADKIRTSLRRTSIQSRLRSEACLALSRMEAVRVEDYTDSHTRQRSLAILDVTFLTQVSSEDSTDLGYIERVYPTGEIENPDGTPNQTLTPEWDLS